MYKPLGYSAQKNIHVILKAVPHFDRTQIIHYNQDDSFKFGDEVLGYEYSF